MRNDDYDEITVTELKRHLGEKLDEVANGRMLYVTRHGQRDSRLVVMREDALRALRMQTTPSLDDLRAHFDAMTGRMDTPEHRTAASRIGTASTRELGEAALRRASRRRE